MTRTSHEIHPGPEEEVFLNKAYDKPETSESGLTAQIRTNTKDAPGQVSGEISRRDVAVSTRSLVWDFKARGEPFMWLLGGGLGLGIFMVIGFVLLFVYNGILTFYPRPIEKVTLKDGSVLAGELSRSETYKIGRAHV